MNFNKIILGRNNPIERQIVHVFSVVVVVPDIKNELIIVTMREKTNIHFCLSLYSAKTLKLCMKKRFRCVYIYLTEQTMLTQSPKNSTNLMIQSR